MDLIEKIARSMECQYQSDLHYVTAAPYQVNRINRLSETDFTLEEYNEAAEYILQRDVKFSSAAEAKQAIIEYLRQEKK